MKRLFLVALACAAAAGVVEGLRTAAAPASRTSSHPDLQHRQARQHARRLRLRQRRVAGSHRLKARRVPWNDAPTVRAAQPRGRPGLGVGARRHGRPHEGRPLRDPVVL